MKRVLCIIAMMIAAVVCLSACKISPMYNKDSSGKAETSAAVTEEGEFFIRFNTFGESSYDSETGVLIKTTAVVNRDKSEYETVLVLDKETKSTINGLIASLPLTDYPNKYDPFLTDDGSSLVSSPSVTLVLSAGGKTVTCTGVTIGKHSENPKGQHFLDVFYQIVDLITATDEWKALPDYEVYYD